MYSVRFRNTVVAYMPKFPGLTMCWLAYLPRKRLGHVTPRVCALLGVKARKSPREALQSYWAICRGLPKCRYGAR